MVYVHELNIELEAFVSSKLNPQFILWNGSIVPCKPTVSKNIASINLTVISFPYLLTPPIRMHTHMQAHNHANTHTYTYIHSLPLVMADHV